MANSQQAQAFCSTTTWPRQRRRRRQRSPMPALLPVVRLFETLLGSGGGRLPPPGSTGPLYFGQHPRPLPRCRWLPPPPKSRSTLPGNPAPSALATPPRDAPPRRPTLLVPAPSALRLSRLLMEEAGFFDEGANIRRPPPPPDLQQRASSEERRGRTRSDAPPPRPRSSRCPVCDAVQIWQAGLPTPAQEGEDNDARADWSVKCGRFLMIGF